MSVLFEGDPRAGGEARAVDISAYLDRSFILSVLRRRAPLVVLSVIVFGGAGYCLTKILPRVYRASASILVESAQIPENLVMPTVSTPATEQVQLIQQRILTRDTLLDIAQRHHLFGGADSNLSPSEEVVAMRSRIDFEQTALATGGRSNDASIAFTISFDSGDPGQAAGVVNDLVTQILQQNAEYRKSQAEVTASFFQQEVTRLSDQLAQIESQMSAYQKANEQAMPATLEYRRTQLSSLLDKLQRLELERIDVEQQQAQFQDQLAGVGNGSTLAASESELAELKRTLVRRQAILGPTHPEIRGLEAQIATVEKSITAEEAAAKTGKATRSTSDPATVEISHRLDFSKSRLDFIDKSISQTEKQRQSVEQSIAETPAVELKINTFQRTYDDLKSRYDNARAKLAEAQTGQRLEDKQQGQRFTVMEQAVPPDEPIKPNKKKILALAIAGGLAVGGGIGGALEFLGRTMRRPLDLMRINREAVAIIPYISTPSEVRRGRARRFAITFGLVAAVAAALWAVDTYYLPLPVILRNALVATHLDHVLAGFGIRVGG